MQTTLDFPKRINFINKSDNEDPQFQTKGSAGFDFRANIDKPSLDNLRSSLLACTLNYLKT